MSLYLVGDEKPTEGEIRWLKENLGSREEYFFWLNEALELLKNPTGFHNVDVGDYVDVVDTGEKLK